MGVGVGGGGLTSKVTTKCHTYDLVEYWKPYFTSGSTLLITRNAVGAVNIAFTPCS